MILNGLKIQKKSKTNLFYFCFLSSLFFVFVFCIFKIIFGRTQVLRYGLSTLSICSFVKSFWISYMIIL